MICTLKTKSSVPGSVQVSCIAENTVSGTLARINYNIKTTTILLEVDITPLTIVLIFSHYGVLVALSYLIRDGDRLLCNVQIGSERL